MSAVGYATLPVVPSFDGIGRKIEQQIARPLTKASKSAGESLEKGVGDGAAAAAKDVEKAQYRVLKSTQELETAESKLKEQKDKTAAANIAMERAAKARADAEGKGADAVAKAEQNLATKRAQAEKASRDLASAEQGVERAMSESANAAKSLEQKQEALEKAQDDLADSLGMTREEVQELEGEFDGLGVAMEESGNKARGFGDRIMSGFKTISKGALLGVGAKIGTEIMSGVQSAMAEGWQTALDLDSVSRSLSAMTSNAEVAQQMMSDLREVAGDKPVDYTAFLDAANTLAYMGYEGDEAVRVLDNIATAAVGAGRDGTEALTGAAGALGKMQANGKVTQNEISMISERGIPVLDMLIEHFGMTAGSYEELKDMIASGNVELDDVFQALGDTGAESFQMLADSAENMSGSLESQIALLKDDMNVAIGEALLPVLQEIDFDAIAESVSGLLGKLVELLPTIADIALVVADNLHWLLPMAGIIGAISAAIFVLNAAMAANPITLAVAAISAAVAALAVFLTQTETGREIWEKFTSAIAEGWNWAVEKLSSGWSWLMENVFQPMIDFFMGTLWPVIQSVVGFIGDAFAALWDGLSWAWENVIQPVFNGIWELSQVTLAVIGTAILGPLLVAWNLLSSAIQWAWENVIQPVWQALSDFAMNVLWPALQNVFQWIGDKWQWLSDMFSVLWGWIRDNVLIPMVSFFQNTLWPAIQSVVDWVVDKWNWLADTLSTVWGWIRDNIIQPMIDGFHRIWNAVSAVAGWIADKWDWMGDQLHKVWRWIDQNVFDPLKSGLDTVKRWFRKGVDGISRVWDGLRAAAAKPVKFVIDTVWNNGILRAWNAIADFLPGIDTVNKIDLGKLGGYAQGGVLPGYTPGRDVHDFYSPTGGVIHLSGGEAIMRPEWTRAVGGEKTVARMNALAKAGKLDEDQMAIGLSHGTLGAFANGGVIGAMANIVRAKYPMLQLTSGYRPGDAGMHGAGLASDWSNGGGNTPEQLALAHDIAKTYPGSAELIYDSPGWSGNIKHGQNVGPFGSYYTMAQAGPHHHHVHWAMTTPPTMQFGGGVFEGGSNGGGPGGGGFFNWIADKAKGIWSDMVDPLKRKIEDMREDSAFWDIPFGFLETIKEKVWSFLSSKFGSGGGVDNGSVDVSDITGPVVDQVEAVFARHGFTGAEWDAAKWIIQKESNWNPTITNPSSGAYGLFQFNPMGGNTLGTYLPDRNPDPAVQADAGARYIKDRYGTPTAAKAWWEQHQWYANGGVLPGYTPGRDVHHFFSPTGGSLALSGGEAIMVPEWTRAVGGPDAVARMNAAASGGRTGSVPGAFAAGGVWQARANEVNRVIADELARIEAHLEKVANPSTYEGIVARSLAGNAKEIAGALGFDGISTVVGGLLGAESELLEARAAHTERLAKITESESALKSARKALSEAKSAEYEDDAARADAVAKATEEVTKAEDELTAAREESVKALDMPVHDLLPQLHDGLLGASRAAADFHPALGGVAANLAQAAAVVGPAGVSVGVAVQTVLTGINLFKTVMGAISDFVSGIINSRGKMFALQAEAMQTQQQWAQTVDDMRESVVGLRVSWVEAQVALRDATWKTRLAQADVVRAQLEGAKTVAEAEAKLEAERKRVVRAATRDFNDLSLLYDRYRWTEYKGMQDRLDLAVAVTPEILALEAEVNAAKLTALANQRSASLSALQASWEQQKAALDLQKVQTDLAMQTQQLALMQSQFGGFGQAESLQAMNTAKLYEDRLKAQEQIGKSWWRLSYWFTGAGVADAKRIKELDRIIAEREAAGKGAGSPVGGTGAMSFFGYGDSASNAVKNSGFGRAEQAMADFQEQKQLQQLELQKQQLEQQIEQNKLFVEYQKQIGDLTAEIEALQAGAASAQYSADAYREDNPAVRSALQELARFEAGRASQYADVAAGRRQVVEITVPQQDTYTREQVEAMLGALQKVDSIDARVTMLETPAKPGANQVLQDITRRY